MFLGLTPGLGLRLLCFNELIGLLKLAQEVKQRVVRPEGVGGLVLRK